MALEFAAGFLCHPPEPFHETVTVDQMSFLTDVLMTRLYQLCASLSLLMWIAAFLAQIMFPSFFPITGLEKAATLPSHRHNRSRRDAFWRPRPLWLTYFVVKYVGGWSSLCPSSFCLLLLSCESQNVVLSLTCKETKTKTISPCHMTEYPRAGERCGCSLLADAGR